MRMAGDQRAPGTDVVDVGIAVDVPDGGAFAALYEGRRATDRLKCANGRIDAARNSQLRPLKQCAALLHRQAPRDSWLATGKARQVM
jgi:hypothetical protein